jgi:hypothetical protein
MMTRRNFLQLWRGNRTQPAARQPEEAPAEENADSLRQAYMRAMEAGIDPATLAQEELVRRFSSKVTSNNAAD